MRRLMLPVLLFAAALAALAAPLAALQPPTATTVALAAPEAPAASPVPANASPAPVAGTPASPAPSGGVLNVGAAFGWLAPYVDSLVGGILSSMVAWVLYWLQTKLKLNVDRDHREALTAFLQRQASSLVADGFVKIQGLKVHVDSIALRDAAVLSQQFVKDAVDYYNVTPATVEHMIVDKIPTVPTVVAATAPGSSGASAPPLPVVLAPAMSTTRGSM